SRLEGPSSTYHIPLALRLEGPLAVAALTEALTDVVTRHESLRTIFPDDDGVPMQRVLDSGEAMVPLYRDAVDESGLEERLVQATATPIDVRRELPLQAWLFRASPDRHVLLLVLHHIAGDGSSLEPLARDVAHAYQQRSEGRSPRWRELPVQYVDYTLWQRALLG